MKRFLIPLAPILVGGALFISAPAAANGDHDCDSYQGSTWPHEDECEPDDYCERKPWKPECQETTTSTSTVVVTTSVAPTTTSASTVPESTSTTTAATTTTVLPSTSTSPPTTTPCVDCTPGTQVITVPPTAPTTLAATTTVPTVAPTTTIPKQCKDANGVVTTDPARCAVIPTTGSEHVVLGTIGGLMILGGLALFASVTWLPAYLARRKR